MKTMLSAVIGAAFATTALVAPTAAHAGSADGKWQVKVLGTGVLPDGKIDEIKSIDTTTTLGSTLAGVTGPDTRANDNVVPTLAVEYFFTPNVSVETICCFTTHHVEGDKGLAGAGHIVDHVMILPATVTAKAHLPLGAFKPYVGAGPALFFVFGEKPGDTAKALNGYLDEKMSAGEAGIQALGFKPTRISDQQQAKGDIIAERAKIKDKRDELRNKYLNAGSAGSRAKIKVQIIQYNRTADKRMKLSIPGLDRMRDNDARQGLR